MEKKKIALLGRPNVGKSALFNRIVGRRFSIVDEIEGVTRDRLYAEVEHEGTPIIIIDTGGIDPKSKEVLAPKIIEQSKKAMEEADLLVLVVDGQVGLTLLDIEIARLCQKTDKPLLLALNKCDLSSFQEKQHDFYSLGISSTIPLSAIHGINVETLLDKAISLLPSTRTPKANLEKGVTKVAIVGRPNVGKSTLVNTLLDEERCIVSPIAGTTRDCVDIPFTLGDKKYLLIDTAGLRRKKNQDNSLDHFANLRTEGAIERADICLLILDVRDGVTTYEKKIANIIEQSGKGCILVLNKWDLLENIRMEHCLKAIGDENAFLAHCPCIAISAMTGRNCIKLFSAIEQVREALHHRVTTSHLNKFLERAMQINHPPMLQGKRLRIYYMTQTGEAPPAFALFCNRTDLMAETYERYLLNQFRQAFPFAGVPVKFILKAKKPQKEPVSSASLQTLQR